MGHALLSGPRTAYAAARHPVASLAVLLTLMCMARVACAADQPPAITGCLPFTLADGERFNAPQFEKFGVNEAFSGKPARPALRGRQARRFRTQLRNGAAAGPNFAGHYTIVAWGCGTSCVSFAIIDAKNGKVFFPPGLGALAMDHAGLAPGEADPPVIGLRHRRDSRLLVVLGAPNEDLSKEGIFYYEWNGSALQRLLFLRNQKTDCPDQDSGSAAPATQP